jgi:glutathione peroxidase
MRQIICLALLYACSMTTQANCPDLLNQSFSPLKGGEKQNLCQYQGKVLLVVNTASYCGFTPQYKGLESLYQKYRDRGLVVLGFPSNDFGRQEPGAPEEIAEFCERTYRVKFPMFEKSVVKEASGNPLYDQLAALSGERPKWNFHKYLVDRSGKTVTSYTSSVSPDDAGLIKRVEELLGDK